MSVNINKVKKSLKRSPKKEDTAPRISTGSTLLNLAISGDPDESFSAGQYVLFVGDSQAGKSWLSLQILAEACLNPAFDSHRLIHDNPERGTLMDLKRYFGPLSGRIEAPSEKGPSRTLEEFYDNVDDATKQGPCIYVLDSEDALKSEQEVKKAKLNKSIRRGNRQGDIKGDYGDGKAKKNSSGLRLANNAVAESKSILVIIKQTRDNIGPDAKFNPKTRSGGRALTFYAQVELWFSIKGKIKKAVRGKNRVIGTMLRIHVKKNRVAGRDRSVEIHFYPDSGMDDVGSNICFLIEEGYWKVSRGHIDATEFDYNGTYEELICKIQEEGWEGDLKKIVAQLWQSIEDACKVERKNRYTIG